jgi:hypothetical protein
MNAIFAAALDLQGFCDKRGWRCCFIGEGALRTCSADDLVIHKVFAGRDQDWLDVRGILVRSGHGLDLALIERELGPLLELKQASPHLAKLRLLVDELLQ